MKFLELTEEEYREFWQNHPLKTFLSAPEISKLREDSGWETYYVGVKDEKELLAATMLLAHNRHFGKKEFYSPRGYLADFLNKELISFFTQELKKYIRAKNGYILRMDPYVIYKERDIDGHIVEDGIDHSDVVKHLYSLGFQKVPIPFQEQVGWMFSLDLKDKTEETILKEMKPNTRNIIRKTEKFGITVKEISYEELDKFQNIMEETSKRKGFSNRQLSYYQKMYELFSPKNEIKFFITELNLKDYIHRLKQEKCEKCEKMENLNDAKYNDKERENIQKELAALEKRIKESEDIQEKEKTDVITLSGSMFMLVKPEVIYLSSGNYEKFMKFNSQYLIQWQLIQYGIKNGFQKHNFYGIPADIENHPKDYGIYEFKRGFNGYVEELIGEFELPITWHYYLLKMIHKIKSKIR